MYQGYSGPPPSIPPSYGYGQGSPNWAGPSAIAPGPLPTRPPPMNSASYPLMQYPGPPPSIANDPDGFAQMYRSHLAALTFNSKPIITNLTVMAQDNSQSMANVIARCIDEHITQAPPPHRLPALYTLDSITKNIGEPYTSLWSQRIAHLFLDSYRIVDHATKARMEELLTTWRTGGSGGKPIFGGEAQWTIERNLYGNQGPPASLRPPAQPAAGGGRSPGHFSGSQSPAPGPQDDRSRALEQIDRLLTMAAHQQHRDPKAFSPPRLAALKQLKNVVQTSNLSPTEMTAIQGQLDSLAAEFERARAASATPTFEATPLPNVASTGTGLPANVSDALANLSKLGGLANLSGASAPAPAAAPATSSSNDLIKSLMAAGLLPSTSGTVPKPKQQDEDYTSAIMSLEIKLTSMDLQKELSDSAVELVSHRHLPLQCRQCTNRYPGGPKGQARLDKHLDWHFRQGRRAKDSAARGMSRSWFDRALEWIRGGQDDPSAAGGAGESSSSATKGLSAQQEQELKAASESWVPSPTSAALANAPCPICKEKFQSEWSEDEEEWIWKNARKVEGAYYHGSCYYSAKTLSTTVASNRTTTPPGRRSTDRRSRTASPPPVVGGKKTGSANPIERVKDEEVSSSSLSRKRKESPVSSTAHSSIAEEAADGEGGDLGEAVETAPEAKRVAL